MYIDCDIVDTVAGTDRFGHPLSTFKICDVVQPLVFLRWYAQQDLEVRAIHIDWIHIRYPVMRCGDVRCINHNHMSIGRYSPTGIPEPEEHWEETISAFHKQQKERGKVMADLKDLKKSISESSDEELMELIRGTRKSRRDAPQKKEKAKLMKVEGKKKTSAKTDLVNLLSGMSPEEQLMFLESLDME